VEHRARARGFDVAAFFAAIDDRRRGEGLSWSKLAAQMWDLSADLNDRRADHPIAASTISGMARRGDASCQHALIMLRWLGQAPEEFIVNPRPGTDGVPLPHADAAHRLRWDLSALHASLNAARLERKASWAQAARRLHCSPHQLTGLRAVKFASGMRLTMRICQALGRPAATFIYAADW